MAAPNADYSLTLADWAKRLDPDGSIATIVELLNQTNMILDDAIWLESNLPTGHRTTVRSDIPHATWRLLNYGVLPTKSKTSQITDSAGMLETYGEVDKDLAMLNGNTAEFRLSEDRPKIEGMNQDMATTIFYGDTGTHPERFLGLAPRYNAEDISGSKPPAQTYLKQVIDGGGTGDVTSLWLIVWGSETVHMFFPKGSKAGLSVQDLGQKTLYDADGGQYEGYRTHYQWKAGMCVRDWRYIVRICNLSVTADFDYKLMIKALNTIPTMGMGKAVFYCTRAIKSQIDIAAAEKTNNALRIIDDEQFGKSITSFWNVPIKQTDAILETESAITFA